MPSICDARQALVLEKEAIAKQKLSVEELMDAAGKALADEVSKKAPNGLVIIVCGKGNNAGDGFVAARYLNKSNIAVKVIALYGPSSISKEAYKAYERLPQALIEPAVKSSSLLRKAHIIVDAVFGFSFKPPIKGLELETVKKINSQDALVISADVPSGLEASTGVGEEGKVVKAGQTVCFSCIKKGLLVGRGPDYSGQITVADVSIKKQIINKHKTAYALDSKEAAELLPKKKALTHKKSAGRVLIIGGSAEYTGAPVLAGMAALRSGAGFVMLAVPRSIKAIIQQKTTEIVVKGLPDTDEGTVSLEALDSLIDLSAVSDAIAIGPGLTTNKEAVKLVISLLRKVKKPVIIDADGVNALAVEGGVSVLKELKMPIVITPHSGELSALTGISAEKIEKERFDVARNLASANLTVLLKGRYSVIAAKNEIIVNVTSNPGMATAGTGDVLTGIIAALIAQGLSNKAAAVLGAFIHGLAGDIAAKELSEYSLIANDLIKYLPKAFNRLLSGSSRL